MRCLLALVLSLAAVGVAGKKTGVVTSCPA